MSRDLWCGNHGAGAGFSGCKGREGMGSVDVFVMGGGWCED